MATNQTGIAITIRAFLPIGKNLDQQLAALTLVKTAHETSDYASLLGAAKIDEVKTEQKTRRVEDAPSLADEISDVIADTILGTSDDGGAYSAIVQTTVFQPDMIADPASPPPDETEADIPTFLKGKKPAKAA